jgi:hypothetical protein
MGAGGRYGKSRVIASHGASLPLSEIMAGLVPAIYVFHEGRQKDADARDSIRPELTKIFPTAMSKCHLPGRYWDECNEFHSQSQEIAMNYTLLIYENAAGFDLRSTPDAAARQAYWGGFMAYTKALQDAGVMVGGGGLQPTATATTVRMRNGKRHVQDGPYADTKEQLGGYYLINVPDLDTALEWAARIPAAPGSVIEVRPNLLPPG